MPESARKNWKPLVPSPQDVKHSHEVPITPQTQAPAYKLAFDDKDFLCSEELRPVRLQLELLKAENLLRERGIESTE